MIPGIGDVEIARVIEAHRGWPIQAGQCRGSAVSGVALDACSGDGGDDSIRRDTADAVIIAIGDVDVPELVHRDAGGMIKPRVPRIALIPEGCTAAAGEDSRGRRAGPFGPMLRRPRTGCRRVRTRCPGRSQAGC